MTSDRMQNVSSGYAYSRIAEKLEIRAMPDSWALLSHGTYLLIAGRLGPDPTVARLHLTLRQK